METGNAGIGLDRLPKRHHDRFTPHAWGDWCDQPEIAVPARFTPTRVGRFSTSALCWRSRSVHPHTRGEIAVMVYDHRPAAGSPPHAWGDYSIPQPNLYQDRFTPTRVGRLNWHRPSTPPAPVHPHTRGEIAGRLARLDFEHGSPPHAWGDCLPAVHRWHPHRFTPTRVGRLCPAAWASPLVPVHPHTRGEIFNVEIATPRAPGSPPHAWGDSKRRMRLNPGQRFTPTRVGRFPGLADATVAKTVHPHTRGEIWIPPLTPHTPLGSPPHAWGDCELWNIREGPFRFTPTRVGRFCLRRNVFVSSAVHPHTRGEIAWS